MVYQYFNCIYCKRRSYSRQAIAAHAKCHFKDRWVKGTPQRKLFVSFFDFQHDSTLISSIPQPPPPPPPLILQMLNDFLHFSFFFSRGQRQVPRHYLRLRAANTLCTFKGEVILILHDFLETGLFYLLYIFNSVTTKKHFMFFQSLFVIYLC